MSTYVFSLEGFAPSPLYDAPGGATPAPFTNATIQWTSTLAEATWVDLETFALDPVDADPSQPQPRNLTTRLAPEPTGWLRVLWSDADSNTQESEPVAMRAPFISWAPSVQDVADVSQAYTRRRVDAIGPSAGAPQGSFDETTNPKASQVSAYIAAAVSEVAGRVGRSAEALEPYAELARVAAKWHAATTVEAEHGSPAADDLDSARQWKQASYVAALNELIAQARPHAFTIPLATATSPALPAPWWDELIP